MAAIAQHLVRTLALRGGRVLDRDAVLAHGGDSLVVEDVSARFAARLGEVDRDELDLAGKCLDDGADALRELGGDPIPEELDDAVVVHDCGAKRIA